MEREIKSFKRTQHDSIREPATPLLITESTPVNTAEKQAMRRDTDAKIKTLQRELGIRDEDLGKYYGLSRKL